MEKHDGNVCKKWSNDYVCVALAVAGVLRGEAEVLAACVGCVF
jgi:hypothetical protein